jgi:pathogenesis-related protein 1
MLKPMSQNWDGGRVFEAMVGRSRARLMCGFVVLSVSVACSDESDPDSLPAPVTSGMTSGTANQGPSGTVSSASGAPVNTAVDPATPALTSSGGLAATSTAGAASSSVAAQPDGSMTTSMSAAPSSSRPRPFGSSTSGMGGPGGEPMTPDAAMSSSLDPDASTPPMSEGETGKLIGITAQHNYYREMVDPSMPLPSLTWDSEIAALAQEWADVLAEDCAFEHSMRPGLGENLAKFGTSASSGPTATGADAVDLWYSEIECYAYGTFGIPGREGTQMCTSECDEYGGCGHYTQLVWRETLRIGCGVSSCTSNGTHWDTYVCNYDPPGNYLGEYPY